GVGGAVWFAGRNSDSPPPVATKTPVPIPIKEPTLTPEPVPAPKAKLVELRFDSLPSGAVFADGQSAELCRTPCSFDVDLGDGGSTQKRVFVIKSEGHEDGEIVVDLTSSQREYNIRLAQVLPVKAAVEAGKK